MRFRQAKERGRTLLVYLSHGIFWGPPCTLTEAIFSAHKLLLRESRRDIGMVGAKALAVPAATAKRATCVQDNLQDNLGMGNAIKMKHTLQICSGMKSRERTECAMSTFLHNNTPSYFLSPMHFIRHTFLSISLFARLLCVPEKKNCFLTQKNVGLSNLL